MSLMSSKCNYTQIINEFKPKKENKPRGSYITLVLRRALTYIRLRNYKECIGTASIASNDLGTAAVGLDHFLRRIVFKSKSKETTQQIRALDLLSSRTNRQINNESTKNVVDEKNKRRVEETLYMRYR
ncbi:hypothetical protein M0812_07766 [Anaeramoeba flamelloides]|uniref:Uncharacterized protein n=1 Tax=Anaeramoeba flamelloides TaxID=1746091 RepID=A0AAV8A2C7_9EUKA|nr:hypothetical protein M0812_07766 [Anaeramoeba flamelloides]